jgi:hypothetical protein
MKLSKTSAIEPPSRANHQRRFALNIAGCDVFERTLV